MTNEGVTAAIEKYERNMIDTHRSGTLGIDVIAAIERLCGGGLNSSVETGCGKSTILLSNLARCHLAFTLDDREWDESSVKYFTNCFVSKQDRCTFIFGPTQR